MLKTPRVYVWFVFFFPLFLFLLFFGGKHLYILWLPLYILLYLIFFSFFFFFFFLWGGKEWCVLVLSF